MRVRGYEGDGETFENNKRSKSIIHVQKIKKRKEAGELGIEKKKKGKERLTKKRGTVNQHTKRQRLV